jgi:hypothetical protein
MEKRKGVAMNLCSEGHDDVCYEGKLCPLCEMREGLKRDIEHLEHDIKLLEKED